VNSISICCCISTLGFRILMRNSSSSCRTSIACFCKQKKVQVPN
jgi:hypothetical protein